MSSVPANEHRCYLPSLLQLLHPAGRATQVLVIGDGAPAQFEATADHSADLVLVVPSARELAEKQWLERSIERATEVLAPDALVFVYVPRKVRRQVSRILAAADLVESLVLLHAPGVAATRLLVSLDSAAVRYAASDLRHAGRAKRLAGELVSHLPGRGRFLSRVAGPVTVLAQRRDSRRPLDWAFRAAGERRLPGPVVVRVTWREPPQGAVAICFASDDNTPSLFAKVAWTEARGRELVREGAALRRLAVAARCAGTRVPGALYTGDLGAHTVLLEDAIVGRPSAYLLRSSPRACTAVLQEIAAWLDCWWLNTARAGVVDNEFIDKGLLRPLAQLTKSCHDLDDYRERVRSLAEAVRHEPCPRVAAHNDLTMWNVLRTDSGVLGIVDWEAAEPAGIPLTDFYYAAVDAVAATHGYRDRLAAVRSCFTVTGAHRAVVEPLKQRLQRTLGISAAVAELCFHGCWLHHAANESRGTSTNEPRPFRDIVRWLAGNEGDLAVGA